MLDFNYDAFKHNLYEEQTVGGKEMCENANRLLSCNSNKHPRQPKH